MKKPNFIIVLLFVTTFQAQTKKWTLKECVDYAKSHNINVKQTELDEATAVLDKKLAFGNFLPTINGQASHSWNIC